MTPLASLLAAVESGIPAKNIDFSAIGDYDDITLAGKSCEGSTDAAISLCEAMLPEWQWAICKGAAGVAPLTASYIMQNAVECQGNPARALLIAVLRALVDREATP